MHKPKPLNVPEPLGNCVKLTIFVDSDHASDVVTRQLQTCFLTFIQNSVIDWCSEKQNACEASTFGSEFVAAQVCVEKTQALRHKLCMFGVPIDGHAEV